MKKRNLKFALVLTILLSISLVSNATAYAAAWVQWPYTTWEYVDKDEDVTYQLTIDSKTKSKIGFTVVCYNNRTSEFTIKSAKLNKKKEEASFKYEDSWGNTGKGTLYLGNKKLYLKITETKQSPTAMFGVITLKKAKFKLISNNFG